ncbi:hypothetical protein JTB14_008262 [Gonioctena quinquepunctata]|nr:hypothetical protein JTB14_008262 [Gonioctena quinquepunctata]
MCSRFIFLGLLSTIGSGVSVEKGAAYVNVKGALENYISTGKQPDNFDSAIREYNVPNFFKSPTDTFDKKQVCTLCGLLGNLLIKLQRELESDELGRKFNYLCTLLQIGNDRVCDGFVKLNMGVIVYIFENNPNLNGSDICGIIAQDNECTQSAKYNWEVEIPPGGSVRKLKSGGSKSFNILHISDIHYDPLYTTNKTNNCGEPVCCQSDQSNGTNSSNSCGYWAEYKLSDIPWRTVVAALEQTKNHKYDYVYFTGDIISHRTWQTSIPENSRVIAKVLDAFSEYYKVPVYSILGNHETHPVNLFSEVTTEPYSNQWLFDIMFQKMSKWLDVGDVKETILKGGYYTISPREGFRVVVLNNCMGFIPNWWLIHNPVDPYDQLKWLIEVLLAAEENDERVHILAHIPSGDPTFYKTWAREYRKIVDRFADTITGQFNGHEHRDEFYIYYNRSNSSQPISMAWNGASVVTFDKANPSYKMYSVDDKTLDILDMQEWTFNVTLANLYPQRRPEWYKLYTFKEAWGVHSLNAVEIDHLVKNMSSHHELIDQYYNFKFKNSDAAISDGCDDKCKKDLLCSMVTTEFGDTQICDEVKKMYDSRK